MANREIYAANCEKEFINNLINDGKRLDGRDHHHSRRLSIVFGLDDGCCITTLGNTRVLAQVSSEIMVPKPARPSEGVFQINVELSPMASSQFEAGRSSDLGVEISRLIERCIRESKCIDLESLCIVAKEKVWAIRVDLHLINHDGNITECASIAAVAALSHFRRPHVSVVGTNVIVHPVEDHCPVPLRINHLPFCIAFAIFEQGAQVLADPTDLEERLADGKVVVAMNGLREICLLHTNGLLALTKTKLLQCTNLAAERAQEITKYVKESLEAEKVNTRKGFLEILKTDTILGSYYQPTPLHVQLMRETMEIHREETDKSEVLIHLKAPGIATLGEDGPSKWGIIHSGAEGKEDETLGTITRSESTSDMDKTQESGKSDEEDDVTILKPKETDEIDTSSDEEVDLTKAIAKPSRQWYPKVPF
ncbi:uncharacterized protein Rrp45 [Centruroides vittatus]|uniref:uncharacterized protein Rrp45 n=1 Tax=Centruroides vittatus TaxID=120091 RepID=UPI00350EBD6B